MTGERGVGKSTLYRALSSGLDPGVKAARINANLTSDTREVLAGIVQGFGMAAPANADPRLLIELIVLHVQEQIDAHRYCLVLIDDAHLLELRALEQLLKLVDAGAEEGLRIVFFAEAYFVQSLDKALEAYRSGAGLARDPSDAVHRGRVATLRRVPARASGAARTIARSRRTSCRSSSADPSGMPGRIDELASAILTGELTISDERRWLPRMHRALVVLVLIGAGMGWLIFSGYPKPTEAESEQTARNRIAKAGTGTRRSRLRCALAAGRCNAQFRPRQVPAERQHGVESAGYRG